MADPRAIENAIRRIEDQRSFLQELLIDALGWPVSESAEAVEDIAFQWTEEELRAEGLDRDLANGTIHQLRPFRGNPWGIFILEFNKPDLFTATRGMTGLLRRVLRGLVPSKRKLANLASFKRENLLFICTHNYQHYRFAYFKAPKKNLQTAPLAAFGWGPGDPIRTVCEFNLAALAWSEPEPDDAGWIAAWAEAFDVERVTKRFYQDYAGVFERVEELIGAQSKLKGDDLRLFTQTLFNRLMFLRFIERKGWLEFTGQESRNYLAALMSAGPIGKRSFYRSRLRPLFFEGLAVEGKQVTDTYGSVPFLNGGLFEESPLDERVSDVPDAGFSSIIGDDGLFYRYNFTVEESTPLDIEVAVDPEMLGKVFEELVTGRHETGSYYTPRPVVSFMCREALKGVLTEKTKASEEAVEALVDRHEVKKLSESHAREILTTLDDLKAVDPACGSGAYLLGLLHEMIAIYRLLYSERLIKDSRSLYELKLRIISQNLYGVDIDRFATNIAMLRLWLSLAVDADEPVPLPNLDFRIEKGDSLLGPNPQEITDLFRNQSKNLADSLVLLKRGYFTAHGEEKESLRESIVEIESRLRELLDEQLGPGIIDWRIHFAEVFSHGRGGFDIVLANPPYISALQFRRKYPDSYREELNEVYECARGAYDVYVLFFERGLQCLKSNGILCFINPNKYLSAKYAVALRQYILSVAALRQLVDISRLGVFESAAVYPVLTLRWTPLVGQPIGLNKVEGLAARETPIGLARPLQLFNFLMY